MAGEQIVIIDDDPDVREALKLILEPAGYKLSVYSTGPDGIAAIRANPPDLIILDIMLASPSEGFHLAYDLRKDDELKRIPIVMVSAIGQTVGMDFAKELGSDYVAAERFLDKPLKADTVLAAVQETLANVSDRKAE